jgi:hypothetical protein
MDISSLGVLKLLTAQYLFACFLAGIVVMMLLLSWPLFLLALITTPLSFGVSKLYGDLMAVNKTQLLRKYIIFLLIFLM